MTAAVAVGWRDLAACRDADRPELFDLDTHTLRSSSSITEPAELVIARFCDMCSVRVECLTDALAQRDTGIRGGQLLTKEHGSMNGYLRCKKRPGGACDTCKAAAAAYQRDRRALHTVGAS